jgi:hypothetical protein
VFFVSVAAAYCLTRPRKRRPVQHYNPSLPEDIPSDSEEYLPARKSYLAPEEHLVPEAVVIPDHEPPATEIIHVCSHPDAPEQPETAIPEERFELLASYRIFSTIAKPRHRSLAFFFSLVLHGGFVFLMFLGLDLMARPQPEPERIQHDSFLVLKLTLLPPRPSHASDAASSAELLDPVVVPSKAAKNPEAGQAADSSPAQTEDGSERRSFELPPATKPKADYTLIQRDARSKAEPKVSIRVPEAVVWSPQELAAKSPIVPGPEFGAKLPDAPLSLDVPKPAAKALPLRELAIDSPVPPPIPVRRVSTAPVKMSTSEEGNRIPESLSRPTQEKSAGHLISVSDIPLPPDALVAIPPISQIAAMRKPDLPAAAAGSNSGTGGAAGKNTAGKDTAGSARDGALTSRRAAAPKPLPTANPSNEAGTGEGAHPADRASVQSSASGRPGGSGAAETPLGPGVVRIDRPQNGKPSSVVLGSSSREAYPESAGVLACKIVYTVYVQVGLPKSWILQFCLPDANDRTGAAAGTVAALDAPWPFHIIRPPITGLDGDYTLVHGVVNTSGHFERLALVTPDEVAKNELIPALQQWEFRSATRDGQPAAVEILLIIPHRQE